jgi:hypothetical protein
MSFLDERDEPPRPARGRRPPRGPAGDQQTIMVRRTVAGGAVVLLLVLMVLGVRGCLDARKERSYRDFATDVGELVRSSNQQGAGLFGILRGAAGTEGGSTVEVETSANASAVDAEQIAERARGLDAPDELKEAQEYLVDVLELRRDGTRAIARQLRGALGDEGREEAVNAIAANMRFFDASDVLYLRRVVPALDGPLRDEKVSAPETVKATYLPDIDWLRPRVVADRISRIAGGEAGEGDVPPGLHGTGVVSVTIRPGGQQLAAGGAVDVPVSEDLAFDVTVQNQGEHEEREVVVAVTISGAGRPIELEESLDSIAPGQQEVVRIPLATQPPTGRPVTIAVETRPVPGEEKTDNNKLSARAIFTR